MKVAVLIDGGYLREIAREFRFNPDFVERIAHHLIRGEERLFRALYYDCDPYNGELTLPVSGQKRIFESDGCLSILAMKDYFAVRRGVLKFRGFKPKIHAGRLSDAHR